MAPTKFQRWIDLFAFLAARRRPVSFEEIMKGVPSYAADYAREDERARSSVRRKFERDKAELREVGIPIETVETGLRQDGQPGEGYRLARGDFYLPYLRILRGRAGSPGQLRPGPSRPAPAHEFALREHELKAALEGLEHVCRIPASPLGAAARSALRKLTFDLAEVPTSPSTVLYLDPPGGPDPRDALESLTDALLRRKRVTFRYHGIRRNHVTDRCVEPYGLVFARSRWYLVGRDAVRGAVRTFRVSRMEAVQLAPERAKTPDYDVPSDFVLSAYAAREAWRLAEGQERPLRVRVRFGFPRSLWAARNGHGVLVEEHPDGSSGRDFDVTDTSAFLRWLLSQGSGVTIELPAELREELAHLAARIADAHAGPVGALPGGAR